MRKNKKSTIRVHVTFRRSDDPLTCMFEKVYGTVKEAKEAIKFDAAYFLAANNLNPVKGVRQSARWIDKKTNDYYKVTAKNGTTCIWQYFSFIV